MSVDLSGSIYTLYKDARKKGTRRVSAARMKRRQGFILLPPTGCALMPRARLLLKSAKNVWKKPTNWKTWPAAWRVSLLPP